MAVLWTNENVFKLIKLFEERELLWNTSLEEYKNRDEKHKAWCEIAKVFKVDTEFVKRKIKSLITQFQRELRNCKYNTKNDDESTWFAFKNLLFLKYRSMELSRTFKYSRQNVAQKVKNESKARVSGRVLLPKNKRVATKPKHQYTTTKTNTIANQKKVRPHKSVAPEENRTLSILQQMHETQKGRDEFDVFGEHVAIKLRQLSSSRANNTAQYHINNILYSAAMGEYDLPSNRNSSHGISNTAQYYNRSDPRPNSPVVPQSSLTQGVSHSSVDDPIECLDEMITEIKEEVY